MTAPAEALIFDAIRTPRGLGKPRGSLHEVKPVDLLGGLLDSLRERHPDVPRRAVLADVRDESRIRRLLEEIRPELVFHAAALKHVPMVENDPLEGLLTNALGTRVVADAARAVGCRAMVFISTDKAVNPTSVMGASKRLAELNDRVEMVGFERARHTKEWNVDPRKWDHTVRGWLRAVLNATRPGAAR